MNLKYSRLHGGTWRNPEVVISPWSTLNTLRWWARVPQLKPSGCLLPSAADAASTSTIVHIPWFCWARSGSKLSGALHVIQYHSKTNKALVDLFDVTNIPRSPNREQFLTLLGFARWIGFNPGHTQMLKHLNDSMTQLLCANSRWTWSVMGSSIRSLVGGAWPEWH